MPVREQSSKVDKREAILQAALEFVAEGGLPGPVGMLSPVSILNNQQ